MIQNLKLEQAASDPRAHCKLAAGPGQSDNLKAVAAAAAAQPEAE